MRGVARSQSVSCPTLVKWLLEAARKAPEINETLAEPIPTDVLEADKLWGFVFKKKNKRWLWIVICRRTRQIIAYFIGDRSEKSCKALYRRIPKNYRQCICYTKFIY